MLNAYLTTHLEIIPASGALGAELQGINLADPVAPDTASVIRGALAEHGVIFFRDQKITPEQHIAFARESGANQYQPLFQDSVRLSANLRSPQGACKPAIGVRIFHRPAFRPTLAMQVGGERSELLGSRTSRPHLTTAPSVLPADLTYQ